MVGVPCRSENLSYGENEVLFYQPVQELWHFTKNSRWRTFFENLRVFPTIDFFGNFLDMFKRSRIEHVPEEKCCHLFFSV